MKKGEGSQTLEVHSIPNCTQANKSIFVHSSSSEGVIMLIIDITMQVVYLEWDILFKNDFYVVSF